MGSVRIIGGKWRSRKILWPDSLPIRPTQNMTRETLFNWLGKDIIGATCLDLFAGTGALGFEALSRGAARVVMIDRSKKVLATLKKNAEVLEIDPSFITFILANIPQQFDLIPKDKKFDVVFIDPPFHQNLVSPIIEKLSASASEIFTINSLIYIEVEKCFDLKTCLPKNWQILRHKTQGQAAYYLILLTPISTF